MWKVVISSFAVMLLLVFVSSCNKNKSVARKLDGSWEMVSFRRTAQDGISIYANPCSGTMTFDSKGNDESAVPYTVEISYTFENETPAVLSEKGTIQFTKKGEYLNVSQLDSTGTLADLTQYRILTRTSNDLQLEFTKGNFTYQYLLKKEN